MSFVVPARTLVWLDETGRPREVATNTGQAPCADDVFSVVGSEGGLVAADAAVRQAVLDSDLAGTWTPGVPRPLTHR